LNSTEFVQLAPAASVVEQVVAISKKDVAFVPVIALAAEKVAVVVPVFLMVMTCAAVVVPRIVEANVSAVGVMLSVGIASPVPFSVTVCVPPVALSLYVTAAVSAPATVGLNSTELEQLAPAASVVEHVVALIRNEVAFVPVIALAALKVAVAVPVFLIVTIWAAVVVPRIVDANVSDAGVKLSVGAVAVPLRATVWGELPALSVALSVAERLPAVVGLKVTVTTQEPPAARLVPHALVSLNEVAFVPVMLILVSASAAVPALLNLTVAVFVAPTAVAP
jgi:hypothetical protein